jgi:hypothetical protein
MSESLVSMSFVFVLRSADMQRSGQAHKYILYRYLWEFQTLDTKGVVEPRKPLV